MVEIVGGIVCHADPPHDRARAHVRGVVNETSSSRPTDRERVMRARERGLRRVALPPVLGREAASRSRSQGVKCASNAGTTRPTKPMNGATPGTSTAHGPKPCARNAPRTRARARRSARRGSSAGMYSITRGSALSAANGSRSSGRHCAQQQALGADDRRAHGARRRAAAAGRCAPESPTATASSRTTPAMCARISFSIFIASTIMSTCARLDGIALADLDAQHRALHRARHALAARAAERSPARAARPGGGARPRAARRPAARPRRRSARRRPRPRSAAARRGGRAGSAGSAGASASASSPSISPAQVSPAMNDGCWRISRCSGTSVGTPSTTSSSSARSMRRRARSRSLSQTQSLAISGS